VYHINFFLEDLEIAPDFFSYFLKARELLYYDKSLFCVSAWNDNGRPGLVRDQEKLYRTDFFPGLGWMMRKELWMELGDRWPAGYWDDWLREPPQRQGRACIYPEISRTYTFGLKDGISQGQFADTFLKSIILNDNYIEWHYRDLTYLIKQNYDIQFVRIIQQTTKVKYDEVDQYNDKDLFVEYSKGQVESICSYFGLMSDEKVGVLRTSYEGVITFWRGTNKIFLGPAGTKERMSE